MYNLSSIFLMLGLIVRNLEQFGPQITRVECPKFGSKTEKRPNLKSVFGSENLTKFQGFKKLEVKGLKQ